VFSPYDLAFQLIKSKKKYKTKSSTKIILKKTNKDNFRRKKTMRKNVEAIDNVL